MKKEIEMIEIPVEFLTDLLNIRKEHYKICSTFSIPIARRSESWVGEGINERIRTYIQGYIGKRSIVERENGAAFQEELAPLIVDPVLPDTKGHEE